MKAPLAMDGTTLVLGGSGFLGSHVLRACARAGMHVVAASREPSVAPLDESVESAPFDALHQGALDELFARARPRCVIVCTALSRIADCEAYPRLASTLNVDLPRRAAELACAAGARLVHVSTDLVFGAKPPPAGGFRESDPAAPVSVYGRTKADGEEALLTAHASALVVRLPLLFGPSGGRGLGASDGILAALARGERPVLFEDEWRTPLSVVHAAQAVTELARRDDVAGRLHVAGRERVNRHELGCAVLHALGRRDADTVLARGKRGSGALAATRPADVSLDATRARALLSFSIPTIEDALRESS
ncbi:MAG: SDR family oxidoreductase [Planctomycetota bacterium]